MHPCINCDEPTDTRCLPCGEPCCTHCRMDERCEGCAYYPCCECGEPDNDGEGYDGLCGTCADRAESMDEFSVFGSPPRTGCRELNCYCHDDGAWTDGGMPNGCSNCGCRLATEEESVESRVNQKIQQLADAHVLKRGPGTIAAPQLS
jgi:hypothetical protein